MSISNNVFLASSESLPYQNYLAHLGEISSFRAVTVREPLFDRRKQLLFKPGHILSQPDLHGLTQADLARPIIECISIEGCFSPESLFATISQHLTSNPELAAAYQFFECHEKIQEFCQFIAQVPALRQHLTLLSLSLPVVFEQSIFCAWLGVVVMSQTSRLASDERDIFLAGMCHDLGLLCLPLDLGDQNKVFVHKELSQMRTHSALGQKLLKELKCFPDTVSKAVWEHHENLDGTGYPLGRLGAMLSRHGQMLNALDCLHAIYVKRYRATGRSLKELVAVIKMNGHGRFGVLGKKLIELLDQLPQTERLAPPSDRISDLMALVSYGHRYIKVCSEIFNELNAEIGFRHASPALFALQNAIIHIGVSTAQSGLINDGYVRWLDQVRSENLDHAYTEIEDAYLLIQEVVYHIEKLAQSINLLLVEPPCLDLPDGSSSSAQPELDDKSLSALSAGLKKLKELKPPH